MFSSVLSDATLGNLNYENSFWKNDTVKKPQAGV